MIGILEYKAGNQTSVHRALEHLGISSVISDNSALLESCDGLIFPGVGAAGSAMQNLREAHLDSLLKRAVEKKIPLLGICLGCQILLEYSEENNCTLLGLIPGQCRRFPPQLRLEDGNPAPVPHMGWNTIEIKNDCPLFTNIPRASSFYFVHSYFVEPEPSLVLATTSYGIDFCSVYGQDGLWAVQFHPEKSGRPGLTLLANFHSFCTQPRKDCHVQ